MLAAAAWIVISGAAASWLFDPDTLAAVEVFKGLLFVLVTGGVLYWVSSRVADNARREAERLRLYLEQVPDLVYRYRTSPEPAFEFVSPRVEEVTGYSTEELYEDPALFERLIHPDDRHILDPATLADGEDATHTGVVRTLRKDGSVIWTEQRCRRVTTPEGVTVVEGIVRDVTDRHAREERLRLLDTAVHQAAEAVMVTDLEGRIEYVNPAFTSITGYAPSEVEGETPRILKSGVHDDDFYRRMWETLKAGRAYRTRFTNRRKEGSLYQQESTITPVKDASGEIRHYVAVARDVSDRALMEGQLRHAQKMEALGRFSAGVAHDFRNLLNVILANAEMAEETEPAEETADALAEIRAAARRGAAVVTKLLAVARRSDTRPEALDVGETVRSLLPALRAGVPETVDLALEVGEDVPAAWADRSAVQQILLNLADNARDAMPGGGRLSVAVDGVSLASDDAEGLRLPPGRYVRLSVSDTGVGMDDAAQAHAFEPFHTTKEPGKGTGLGLAMVWGLAREHGGTVSLYSEEGEGTTFRVYLPVLAGEDVAADAPRRDEATDAPRGTVLLVEDDVALRTAARRVLERMGHRVLVADNGRAALECLEEEQVDLVLSDLVMPEMGGGELAREVRRRWPELPMVLMSGYGRRDEKDLPEDLAFLEKPWTLEALRSAIREAWRAPGPPRD